MRIFTFKKQESAEGSFAMWGVMAKLCALLTLLAMLLLMPTRAMAAEVTARAEYNKTTKVLRFVMDGKTAVSDGNTLVVKLLNQETNVKWFNNKSNFFDWLNNMSDAKSATSVVIEESFRNYKLISCREMFRGFEQMKNITGIENLNVASATTMAYMFKFCTQLEVLDLTSFNTENVTDMTQMFYNCTSLKKIYVSDKFATGQVKQYGYMFRSCTNLRNFNSSYDGKTRAHYRGNGYLLTYYRTADGEIHELSGNELKADLVLDDSKYFVAHAPFTATTAAYSRTMNGGTTWGTLCLPFEVNTEGKNFRTFSVTTVGDDYVELEELQTSIAAGTPVLIKMNEGETEINITEDNRQIATAPKTTDAADGQFQLTGLYTPKTFNKNTDSNCYIVKANKLMNPSKILENSTVNAVGSKAFRAYLTENTTTASAARMFSIGGQTTAIDKIADTLGGSDAQYFDLQGRRLDAPQKGMNIMKRGGKTVKIMIR